MVKKHKANKAHIEHIVTSMCEVISDYLNAGYGYDEIEGVINDNIDLYLDEEGITELDYNKIAKEIKATMDCGEGWTLDDVRFLKKWFKENGVKFEVKL